MHCDAIEWDDRGAAISVMTGARYPLHRPSVGARFLAPTDSLTRWRRQAAWQVFELGFGAGINFLETVLAWRAHRSQLDSVLQTRSRLSYIGLVDLPLPASVAERLLIEAGFAEPEINCLVSRWPAAIDGFHRLRLDAGIDLTLVYGAFNRTMPELTGAADAIYINESATTPRRDRTDRVRLDRPELSALWRLCTPGCRIAGDFINAPFIARLKAAGFGITEQQNRFSGGLDRQSGRRDKPGAASDDRTVAVIGAGIAGLAVARELSHRGWHVTLIERGTHLLAGGSSQPALAAHQHLSPDDNLLSRLTRAAQRLLAELPGSAKTGRLHLAGDHDHASRQRGMIDRLGWPHMMLQYLDVSQASDIAGVPLRYPGLWQPDNHQLDPGVLRHGLPADVTVRTGFQMASLNRQGQRWLIGCDSTAGMISASTVVVCTGAVPAHLLAGDTITTQALFGQSTVLKDPRAAGLRCILGGHAYACPTGTDKVLTGATYRQLPAGRCSGDDVVNRRNWLQLLAGTGSATIVGNHVGVRFATTDRLALIGAMPDEPTTRMQQHDIHRDDRLAIPCLPGVFLACGFGSRGALWAPLAAAIIADQLDGLCLPVEKTLGAAIAPQRFARRAIRHGDLI